MKDFFISLSSADRAWADWIGWQLVEAGYSVDLQGWSWGPGANFVLEMDRAARESRRALIVLSPSFLKSAYAAPEWAEAFREDPKGAERRLVPVKVRPCEPEGLLGPLVHVDLVGKGEEEARRELLDGLGPPGPPDEAPGYPGGPAPGAEAQAGEPPAFPGALPPHWNVPHLRNPHFTGREDLLEALHETLRSGDGSAALTQAIRGLGGVGKTQLALEYAYRHAADYEVVWWVRAEDPEILVRDYTALARELGLPGAGDPDPRAAVQAVRRWLETHGGWLLIFDNAEDPTALRPYLPRGRTGPVLLTSRRSDWDGIAAPFQVTVLPPAEAANFLLERTGEEDAEAAGELAEDLGYLPLALEQAGAYIRTSGTLTLAAYRELFQERREELLKRGAPLDHDAVDTTWDLSFQKLEEESPEAADLLRLLSFFAPEDIPLDLFTDHADKLPEPLSQATADPIRWTDTVSAARRFSLLEVEAGAATVHRLVQAGLRSRLSEQEERRWAESAVLLLDAGYSYEEDDLATWEPALRLLSHVIGVTVAAERLEVALETTSRLLDHTGRQLRQRGVLDQAQHHLERAVTLAERAVGPENPEPAIRAMSLSEVLVAQGDLSGAEEYARRAVSIVEAVYGSEHPVIAAGVSHLGSILQTRGDLTRAEEQIRRGLSITESVYGLDHPEVAIHAGDLGQVLKARGDLSGAEDQTRRALSITESVHGPDHPEVAIHASNLGQILQARGDLAGAEEQARRAVSITEVVYGPDDPRIATTRDRLSQILQDSGDLAAAEDQTRRALTIDYSTYGSDHPKVAIRRNNLGCVLEDRLRLTEAEAEYRRALAIAEARLGPDHPDTKFFADNLADLLERMNED